ncbi:hypothetical protein [uncultured Cohaesibacter sp.]|uniref:hypothetical protein n=1 Tax=uncultured Cohaesibacter sp. TaxID=1002546 RepID=UPI0029C873F6|nr:hypothetical protein [uncultured Cohaesibacter sp.]
MPQIRFNSDLSLGNLLTLLTLLVGMASGWQIMASSIQENRRMIDTLSTRIEKSEGKIDTTIKNLSDERVELARALAELKTELRNLKDAVASLSERRPD